MPKKPKTPQKESLIEVSGRDTFQTPNYAVDLLMPFLPFSPLQAIEIWECAAGLKKIVNRLNQAGYWITATDLAWKDSFNFLSDHPTFFFDCIVTNPPFSLKQKFYKKCLEYQKPFALLIPADYTGWTIDAVEKDGCEKIIPNRRIDYITPNIVRRIWEGEAWRNYGITTCTLKEWKAGHTQYELQRMLDMNREFKYDSIYDAPAKLLRKYSSSYYHSMWLTWGFNIGRTETFVELTNEQKFNI